MPPSPDLSAAHSLHVLVVDDNTTNQDILQAMLTKLGCRTRCVSSGLQAIDAISQTSFDLVLMDCQMPVLDGYEATRAIRTAEARIGGHIPIVAMTANAMSGDREKCLECGMTDYVSKPIDKAKLFAAIDTAVGGVVTITGT